MFRQCSADFRGVLRHDRSANKSFIKLCGDGTFRLMFQQWILATLGTTSKQFSRGDDDHMTAFRTKYHPLIFAIMNIESEPTYRHFFRCLKHVADKLLHVDLSSVVKQYHCDWHAGEENARAVELPESVRAGDWAHFVGATSRPSERKAPPPAGLSPQDAEQRSAWRTGIFNVVQRHLLHPDHIDTVRQWIRSLRAQPTALLFTSLSTWFFEILEKLNEVAACAAIKKHYYRKMPAAEARRRFELQSWPGDPAYIWMADWWAGLEQLQPGSAGATQAQESWHRHDLKGFMKNMRMPIPSFVLQLEKYTDLRFRRASKDEDPLPDTPGEPFPDAGLRGGPHLTRRGRTGAYDYADTNAYVRHTEEDGTTFTAMRRTLCAFVDGEWKEPNKDAVQPPPAALSRHMGALLRATTERELRAALADLGVDDPLADNGNLLFRAVTGKVLVMSGPKARQFWRRPGNVAEAEALHMETLCAWCPVAITCGACEHQQVDYLARHPDARATAHMPKRQKKQPDDIDPASPAPVRLRGPRGTDAGAPASPGPPRRPCCPATPARDKRVGRLLDKAGLSHFRDAFRREGVTLEVLGEAGAGPTGIMWLKAYFPDIPAAAGLKLLQAAATHHQDSPEDKSADDRGKSAPTPRREDVGEEVDLDAGDVPSDAASVSGSEAGEGEQRQWLVNMQTGIAHPTDDGVTPSCRRGAGSNPLVVPSFLPGAPNTTTSEQSKEEGLAFRKCVSMEGRQRQAAGAPSRALPRHRTFKHGVLYWHTRGFTVCGSDTAP